MIIKKALKQLKPYDPKPIEASIYLDANEVNTTLPFVLDQVVLTTLNRYPDHQGTQLTETLCDQFGYQKDTVMIGSGSSELLELIIKTYVSQSDVILSIDPTFVMYQQYATIHQATYISVSESKDLLEDLYQVYITYLPKVIMISNPNNPTGSFIPKDQLLSFIKKVSCVVVIDEAYIEYANLKETLIYDINNTPNLFVTRTFSKAWGLAGARLGYIVSQKDNIQTLKIAKTPYSVSSVTQALGIEALKMDQGIFKTIETIKEIRTSTYFSLKEMLQDIYPSYGNFLYVYETRFNLYEALLLKGIKIRSYQNGYYRITIGTKEEMAQLIKAIKELV
jgi:histidinol-phosphate aminotransferase